MIDKRSLNLFCERSLVVALQYLLLVGVSEKLDDKITSKKFSFIIPTFKPEPAFSRRAFETADPRQFAKFPGDVDVTITSACKRDVIQY